MLPHPAEPQLPRYSPEFARGKHPQHGKRLQLARAVGTTRGPRGRPLAPCGTRDHPRTGAVQGGERADSTAPACRGIDSTSEQFASCPCGETRRTAHPLGRYQGAYRPESACSPFGREQLWPLQRSRRSVRSSLGLPICHLSPAILSQRCPTQIFLIVFHIRRCSFCYHTWSTITCRCAVPIHKVP